MLLCGTQKKWRETQIPLGDEEISKKGGGGHIKRGGGIQRKRLTLANFQRVNLPSYLFLD